MTDLVLFEKAGVNPAYVERFLSATAAQGINFHSVLMMRGNNLFFEKYWEPFHKDFCHRMYSVTKSFVGVAVGCLVDEGRVSLDDPIVQYFPDKLPDEVHPLLKKQTIRDMLTMRTCFAETKYWFQPHVTDRLRFYFAKPVRKPSGTIFDYDSDGSHVLGTLVERVTGLSLLEYLKEKVLNKIGGFEEAKILKTPDGTPWADSAMICTPRALMNFARFVMNYGTWNGERLLSEEYLRNATTRQTDNNVDGSVLYDLHGYGYQIYMNDMGFSFEGMGGQFAICAPDKDFIFVCTADTQLSSLIDYPNIFREVGRLLQTLDDGEERIEPFDLDAPLSLSIARGEAHSPFEKLISGKTYRMAPNPMGIQWMRLEFEDDGGVLTYENEQGEKKLPFGMKSNWFGPFPQAGYSHEYGNVHVVDDFRYHCAVSAGWIEPEKLQIYVQIIDEYFGRLVMTLGFAGPETIGVCMVKTAEDFLNEYQGWAYGSQE